jgi:hypothetical protein
MRAKMSLDYRQEHETMCWWKGKVAAKASRKFLQVRRKSYYYTFLNILFYCLTEPSKMRKMCDVITNLGATVPFECFAVEQEKPPKLRSGEETRYQKQLDALVAEHSNRMMLTWDKTSKTIRMGACEFSRYTNFKNRAAWVNTVLHDNDVTGLPSHPKWRNKMASAVLGGSIPQLYKWFNQLQYKQFVVPYKDLLTKISFQRGRIDSKRLQQIVKHEALLRQAVADGQTNLLPILTATGKTPQELKKEMGKSWKVLCKNSLNKNKAVARAYWEIRNPAYLGNVLTFLGTKPTTVLETYSGEDQNVISHVTAHYRGSWGKFDSKIGRQLRDTQMLASQLEKPFDPLWSPRRMKEEHDSMSREITARRYSPAKLDILDFVPVKTFEHEGYTATLLDSRALVAEEGSAMGHCVAGYAESVANGSYLVYSVRKDGERSSTLGINIRKIEGNTVYSFSQHYGKYNARLTDTNEHAIGNLVLINLNEKL